MSALLSSLTCSLSICFPMQAINMYSLSKNYWTFVLPKIAGLLPVPQRYYVPTRLRDTYKARLEAIGLWDVPDDSEEMKKAKRVSEHSARFKAAFGKSKVCGLFRINSLKKS